jgi:predicted GNAT family acetyltransferase
MDAGAVTVRDNPAESRYELHVDGALAGELRYRTRPGVVVLVHTEIDPSLEGRGLAARLVGGALDDIRSRGLRIVPVCPYVRAFLRRHAEYGDLLGGAASSPG